jgi:molybdopterin-guanine dinucleotide biosynthesis protein A
MPLLHHAVLRLAEVCDEVMIVLAPDAAEPSIPVGSNARFVRDLREGEGPLVGLLAGLEGAATPHAILAGGDMPDLSTAVLLEMLRVAREASVDAVALRDGDLFRPLPSVLRVAPAREAARSLLHAGERSLLAALQSLRTAVIDEDTWLRLDSGRRTLFDVDEPGDLD